MFQLILISMLILIPVVNWIIGLFMGLSILSHLISKRRFSRIIILLPLAFLWFIGSLWWAALVQDKLPLAILGVAVLLVSNYGIFHIIEIPAKGYQTQLNLANSSGNNNFSFDCAFGLINEGAIVCIDQQKQTIAIIWENAFRVEKFNFLTSWELNWIEFSQNGKLIIKDPYIKLATQSFDLPVIKIPMSSKSDGEAWIQRLNLMTDRSFT